MIYLIAFQQDIVFSFVQKLVDENPANYESIKLIRFEDIESVSLDYFSFYCMSLKVSGTHLTLNPEDKIYLRPYSFTEAEAAGIMGETESKKLKRFYQELLLSKQVALGNTSLRSESNNNKFFHPLQFDSLIAAPDSFLTNFENARFSKTKVVKSPSFVRTEVVTVSTFGEKLHGKPMPCVLLQEKVEGVPLRITVVGFEKVVAVEVSDSSAIDYRYSNQSHTKIKAVQLSEETESMARLIAKRYGLPLCGIDVIRDGDVFYFLEVNPEPGWSYLSDEDNLRIFEFILQYLEKARCRVFPDGSHKFLPRISVNVRELSHPLDRHFPDDLRPSDYIARPNSEHPLWSQR